LKGVLRFDQEEVNRLCGRGFAKLVLSVVQRGFTFFCLDTKESNKEKVKAVQLFPKKNRGAERNELDASGGAFSWPRSSERF
jgi:hypothetical protein